MHLTDSSIDWYAIRAAGVVAYVLLTVTVVLGVGLAGRVRLERWPRFSIQDVHRFVGLLTGAFVAIHVGTLAVDSFLPFSAVQLVVPFAASYRPLWTGIGIAAAELLLALAVANRLRRRMPYRAWRALHYLSFVVWAGATVHGIGSGTDRSSPWLLALTAVAVAAVAATTAARILRGRADSVSTVPLVSSSAAALSVAGVVALALALPSAHASAKRISAAFRGSLSGRIASRTGETRQLVSVVATGSGRRRLLVRIDLLANLAGVEATSLQLEYLPSGVRCEGTLDALDRSGFHGSCRLPGGAEADVRGAWTLSQDHRVSGTLRVT